MNYNEIKAADSQYYMNTFGARLPVLMDRGERQYLYDTEGREYTDFLSAIGCCCLGHGDAAYIAAVSSQMERYMGVSNYFYGADQAAAAKLLCELTGYDRVFFANSGAEANEGALKLARKHHYAKGRPRTKVVAAKNSFHGRTFATLAATGQERFHTHYQPLMEKFVYVDFNDVDALKAAVDGDTCAVLLEPIQGEGGVIPATAEYLMTARELCDRTGALLIFDEVQTGTGRTGSFLCQDSYGVKGDVTTLAKALGNGYPVGAVIARGECANAFEPGDHGTTYGGNAVACAAVYHVLTRIKEEKLAGRCAKMGAYFKNALCTLKNFPFVLEIRGQGLIIGIDLYQGLSAADVKLALLERGFIACTAGANVLRFLPSYYIEEGDIDRLVEALEGIFNAKG